MSIYTTKHYNTTSSYFNEMTTTNTSISGNVEYDTKIEYEEETQEIILVITDIIIVFILISILVNFFIVLSTVIWANNCSHRCRKNNNIVQKNYAHLIQSIFTENNLENMTFVEINPIFRKYNFRNLNIDGKMLYYIFNLDTYDKVYEELKDKITYFNEPIDKYEFNHIWDKIVDEFKPHSNTDIYEIYKRKLDAEISIGVLSAIIMGFSISIYKIENYKNYFNTLYNVLNYVHVFIKSIVSGLSMLNVISSTTIYFQGMKIISRIDKNNKNMINDFNKWWNNIEKTRVFIRYCFIYCLPLFLVGFVTNPDIWINNLFLALFNLVIIYTCVIIGSISYCKLIF